MRLMRLPPEALNHGAKRFVLLCCRLPRPRRPRRRLNPHIKPKKTPSISCALRLVLSPHWNRADYAKDAAPRSHAENLAEISWIQNVRYRLSIAVSCDAGNSQPVLNVGLSLANTDATAV
ncbi:hypothetical protein PsYK624_053090 [Phanerochaete sordida]|uniref:Uncharacterized protein n=1 Tax=Phanerochaete sordida TaxID=48140 RepID=A0A9P3LC53_9APHY|nr:hypothetical protein PsYK624_053090 [Phanerochaete sordida]